MDISCSFCGRLQDEVDKLVAGARVDRHHVYICDLCINLAHSIVFPNIFKQVVEETEKRSFFEYWGA